LSIKSFKKCRYVCFLQVDLEDLDKYAQYELLVTENIDMGSDSAYIAEVVARIKT
jgi:hypothetical protein